MDKVTNEPLARMMYLHLSSKKEYIFTVAYQRYRDRTDNNVKYGVSVFRKDNPKETFFRKRQAATASARLMIRPLWTTFNEDDPKVFFEKFEDHMLSLIYDSDKKMMKCIKAADRIPKDQRISIRFNNNKDM